MQCKINDATIERIEAVTGDKFTRGADKEINKVLDMAEGIEPESDRPKVVICSGLKEALGNGQ